MFISVLNTIVFLMIVYNIKPTLALVVALNVMLITYSILFIKIANEIDKVLSGA